MPDETLDLIVAYAETFPTPQSDVVIHQVGGAINDATLDATAYPHREAAFIVTTGARWQEPAQDEACIAWVQTCHNALAKHATGGTYVNFVSEREGQERAAYGPNYERLSQVKAKYDSANLFCMNQNIRPANGR